MTDCYCGSYEGCPIHCDRCKKPVGYRSSCPPLCDSCFDYVFGENKK